MSYGKFRKLNQTNIHMGKYNTEQADWVIKWETELILEKLQSTKLVRMITISELLDH